MQYSGRITHTGVMAQQVLEASTGEVIAVFNNSFYLSSSTQQLCCIGPSGFVGGPINIRTSQSNIPSIKLNSRWLCADGRLTIGDNINFEYHDALLFNTPEPVYRSTPISAFEPEFLNLCIKSPETNNTTNSPLNTHIEQRLQAGIDELIDWLTFPQADVPAAVKDLLGCGEGLTPAGDDILIGAMVVMHQTTYQSKLATLSSYIKNHANTQTNRISAAHLHAACRGLAVTPLHEFVNAMLVADVDLALRAIQALDHYGHRSGRDAMRGATAVISSLQERD